MSKSKRSPRRLALPWKAISRTAHLRSTTAGAKLGRRRLTLEPLEERRLLSLDFGNLPLPYPTTLAEGGPYHTVTAGVFLGASVTSKTDGVHGLPATADPGHDGVHLVGVMQPGATVQLNVSTSCQGYLYAWIDFDGDGALGDNAGEVIASQTNLGNNSGPSGINLLQPGMNVISVTVPTYAKVGSVYGRFRFTTATPPLGPKGLLPSGAIPDGEVEDYQYQVQPAVDFGNAPDSYHTLLASNGARHNIVSDPVAGKVICLGSTVTPEPDAQIGATNADNDGVTVNGSPLSTLVAGTPTSVNVSASVAGYLSAWVDFNGNGTFGDSGEQVVVNQSVSAGNTSIPINVPVLAKVGTTWARFRFSTVGNLSLDGAAANGEVEDYKINVLPGKVYGDAPSSYDFAPGSPSPVYDPASHNVVPGFSLGSKVDIEPGPRYTDNNAGGDPDDDGVSMARTLVPGTAMTATITASAAGYVNAWIDFNANGTFDSGEQVLTNAVVNPGPNTFTINVPSLLSPAKTFGRFRLTHETYMLNSTGSPIPIQPTGLALDGEGEDYEYAIGPQDQDFGDAPDTYQTLEASGGAAHVLPVSGPNPQLGSLLAAETDGQPSANADKATDDDGVFADAAATTLLSPSDDLVRGSDNLWIDSRNSPITGTITVPPPEYNTPPGTLNVSGYLNAWIDFNHDGKFTSDEQVAVDVAMAAGQLNKLPIWIPSTAATGATFARFRVSTEKGLGPAGLARDGEVEDYAITICDQAIDWGDAPDSYGTLKPNGAGHVIPRQEGNVQFNSTDNGGLETGDLTGWTREGLGGSVGVLTAGNFTPGPGIAPTQGTHYALVSSGPSTPSSPPGSYPATLSTSFAFISSSAMPAMLSFDWNCLSSTPGPVPTGAFKVILNNVTILDGSAARATDGVVYSVTGSGTTSGSLFTQGQTGFRHFQMMINQPGEYKLKFLVGAGSPLSGDTGLLVDNVHVQMQPTILDGLHLGSSVDGDVDGQPAFGALNDKDDNGISFSGDMVPGQSFGGLYVTAGVPVNGHGYLNGWVDFFGTGNFNDPRDHVIIDTPMVNGLNWLGFAVPAGAKQGLTYARFRLSSQTGLGATGPALAPDGEVEDYMVLIGDSTKLLNFGQAPDGMKATPTGPTLTYPTLLASNGARSLFNPNQVLFLGSSMSVATSTPPDASPTLNANGGGSGAGVVFPTSSLIPGQTVTIPVTASGAGYLNAWLDYQNDCHWTDVGDQIAQNVLLHAGVNQLTFTVPAGLPADANGVIDFKTYARFRFTAETYMLDSGGNHVPVAPTGLALDGEVEDYAVSISNLDFGDAPNTPSNPNDYPTLLASNGARHIVTINPNTNGPTGPVLGPKVDTEADGLQTPAADGDKFDDGVTFIGPVIQGAPAQVSVTVSGASGYLSAWLDTNMDGDWADSHEKVAFTSIDGVPNVTGDAPVFLTAGPHSLTFTVPVTAKLGQTFMRFRIASDSGDVLLPTGLAEDGEVEDYQVQVQAADYGDAPDSYGTLWASNGPRHAISTIYLGPSITSELDGQPDNLAATDVGDDGVAFLPAPGPGTLPLLLTGSIETVNVDFTHATKDAYLNAWVDFNGNGTFDSGDQIFTDMLLTHGVVNTLTFAVPAGATFTVPSGSTLGSTYARFRVSTQKGLSPLGPAPDGEVEDYKLNVNNGQDYGDAPVTYGTVDPPSATPSAARHKITGLFLGKIVTAEANGQPTPYADGDTGDDGVRFLTPLVPGQLASVQVTASQSGGFLNAWIDYDVNGFFTRQPPEHAIIDYPCQMGANVISFTVPAWAKSGVQTFARFRLSTATSTYQDALGNVDNLGPDGILPDGTVPDGEVEDYQVVLGDLAVLGAGSDWGDAPDTAGASNGYQTLSVNNGANHNIISGVFLGRTIDGESDGQPSAAASLDKDDDGVRILGAMIPGQPAQLSVTASVDGRFHGWIDFQGNGNWNDPTNWIAADLPIHAGVNILNFNVPASAVAGRAYGRFRFTTDLNQTPVPPTGEASPANVLGVLPPGGGPTSLSRPNLDGEVEDYALHVGLLPTLSINDVTMSEGNTGTNPPTNFTFNVTLTLSGTSTDPVTVQYAVVDGTATLADYDYLPLASGTLTFDPRNPLTLTQPITVQVVGDTKIEPNEMFSVVLSNPTNALLSKAIGTGTILNDDAVAAAYTVVLKNAAGNTIAPDGAGRYHLKPGDVFTAEVRVQDVRTLADPTLGGIYSGYADVNADPTAIGWTANSLAVISPFKPISGDPVPPTIDPASGQVREAGGVYDVSLLPSGSSAPGQGVQRLFTVAGQVPGNVINVTNWVLTTLALAPATGNGHVTTVFTGAIGAVSASYQAIPIMIGSPWQNPASHFDVNGDGSVNALDGNLLTNLLQNPGPRILPVPPTATDNPSLPGSGYLDVNGDGTFNQLDLLVWNAFAFSQPLQLAAPASVAGSAVPVLLPPPSVQAADTASLTYEQLKPVVAEAVHRWQAVAHLDAQQQALLSHVQVAIADLPGKDLGLTYGSAVTIDRTAVGQGWFVDATPADDSEFTAQAGKLVAEAGTPAARGVDLLTVVSHELGHVLGLGDQDPAADPLDLMAATLSVGQRKLAQENALDAILANPIDWRLMD